MFLLKLNQTIRSINASSGRDATSVTANSELGEHIGINASFEDSSGDSNVLHVSNVNDETQNNFAYEVGELSVPETRFDRLTNTHHVVTGQTIQTNQIPEFLTGCNLAPRDSQSHQHQNQSTQVSQDNNLPLVERTPRSENSNANICNNRLAYAVALIATQQQPQAAIMLKPVSTNTFIFDGKNEKFELFETFFNLKLKMQPEMTAATKI